MINYRNIAKYKYELNEGYIIFLREIEFIFTDMRLVETDFLKLMHGSLVIKKGYAWDGPSGPTIDTKNFMRGSLIHDALYQLIREGVIPKSSRKKADKILYRLCREDGMEWFRAQYVYRAVRMFGGSSA